MFNMSWKIFLIYFCLKFAFGYGQVQFDCEEPFPYDCRIESTIYQSSNDEFYTFNSSKPLKLYFLIVRFNEISAWNTQVCQQFSHLKRLNLMENKIKTIHPDSFKNCTEVFDLNLSNNLISKLDAKLFSDLKDLKELLLHMNDFHYLDMEVIQEVTNLEKITLYSNYLFEIDANTMKDALPMLKHVQLYDNNFLCSRMSELENKLPVRSTVFGTCCDEREYYTEYFNGSPCLTSDQWCIELSQEDTETQIKVYEDTQTIGNTRQLVNCLLRIQQKVSDLEEELNNLKQKNS